MSRVLLKLSGESFSNPETNFGIEPKVIERIASEITAANNENIQIGVVVGGGNFFRGVQESAKNMAQANADYMGMLATVINAVALKDALQTADKDNVMRQITVRDKWNLDCVPSTYYRARQMPLVSEMQSAAS